jgi:hypothetical protein
MEASLSVLALLSVTVHRILDSPWTSTLPAESVRDARLGTRPNPSYPGHDRNGFRNTGVLPKVDVIAFGDSQTYGANVDAKYAWPRQLEAILGRRIYSMAWGGWGPVHSLILLDDAFSLQPKIVIEAFYAGNDLYDSFNIVYRGRQFPELKSADFRMRESIKQAESSELIQKQIFRIAEMRTTPIQSDGDVGVIPDARTWLSDHSKVYGLIRRARYELVRLYTDRQTDWEKAKAFAAAHAEFCEVFSTGELKTVFTPEYRFSALNLQDPRIAEGVRIAHRAINTMKEVAAKRSIRFIVLLIPTKELVFQELYSSPSASYRRVTENEAEFWKITKKFFDVNRIEYLDALPALRAQLLAGIQPYPVSDDGHPNEHGHLAIAKLVAAYLKSPQDVRDE